VSSIWDRRIAAKRETLTIQTALLAVRVPVPRLLLLQNLRWWRSVLRLMVQLFVLHPSPVLLGLNQILDWLANPALFLSPIHKIGWLTSVWAYCDRQQISGYPHITIAMCKLHGLPFGLSFIGCKNSDNALLSFAYALKKTRVCQPD